MGFANAAGGFSKGFGDSFAQSYGQSRQIQAGREELAARKEEKRLDREYDAYESTIKGHMETAEEMKKEKAKEREYIAKGTALADAYQAPAEVVVGMIRDAGGDTSAVETYLKRGTFTKSGASTASTPSPVADQAVSRPATGLGLTAKPPIDGEENNPAFTGEIVFPDSAETEALDDQTSESGLLGAPAAPSGPTQPAGSPVGESGWTYTPKPEAVDYEAEREKARVDFQRAQASGNPEQIAAAEAKLKTFDSTDRFGDREPNITREALVVKSLEPGDEGEKARKSLVALEQADIRKAQASKGGGNWVFNRNTGKREQAQIAFVDNRRVMVDSQGNEVNGFELDDRFYKDADAILELKKEKPVVDYENRLANTVSATKSLNDMAKIIQQDPKVLTTAAQGVSFANRLSTEAEAAMSILSGQAKGNINPDQIDKFERELDILTPETKNTAELAAIFQAKKKLAAYRMARGEGESASSLSNADVSRFDDVLLPSADPQTTVRGLRELGKQKLGELAPIAENLNRNPRVQEFNSQYGEDANPLRHIGGVIAPSWEDYSASLKDPKLDEAISFINSSDEPAITNPQNQPTERRTKSGRSYKVLN